MKFVIIFLSLAVITFGQNLAIFDENQPLSEYKEVMPPEAFQKLLEIYDKKDMIAIDKFKELDDLFMSLSDDLLTKLPLPKVFRKLPENIQEQIHNVYYNKTFSFENKLEKLDEIISSLPEDMLRLLPIQPEFPEVGDLIEFQVSVLLQFNGYFSTDSLRNYLSPEMYDQILIIARQKDIPEATRAYLTGRILKEAYTENPESFPLPVGEDDNETMPESIKRAGVHLMFSKNPFEKLEPFEKIIHELQNLGIAKNQSSTLNPDYSIPKMYGIGKKIKKGLKRFGKQTKSAIEKIGIKKLRDTLAKTKMWKGIEKFVDGYGLTMV